MLSGQKAEKDQGSREDLSLDVTCLLGGATPGVFLIDSL